MLDVEITLKLPQELLDRVQAAGLRIEDLPTLIDAQLKRIERPDQLSADLIQSRIEQLRALEPKLTQDELDSWIQEALDTHTPAK